MDNFLFEFAGQHKRQAWIGLRPIVDAVGLPLYHSDNFRASPNFHQSFGVVWFYEIPLSNFSGWKIIVDETIRLLDGEGYLVFRFFDNEFFTLPALKDFLWSHIGIDVSVAWEAYPGESPKVIFKIKRKNISIYRDKSWTFGILAGEAKVANVVRFLNSIRALDPDNAHEIIITGAQKADYDQYKVVYNSRTYSEKYAEISKKKNDIISMAQKANVMIVHDRYIINENFFTGFEKYGYDFDFLTVRQFYETGKEFPSYCRTQRGNFLWGNPTMCNNYNQLSDHQYINGGLLIFKKQTAEKIRFNEMLFWNQQEDVALSVSMIRHSIVPRINFISHATTIGIGEEYTQSFLKEKVGYTFSRDREEAKRNAQNIVTQKFKEKEFRFFSKSINKYRKKRIFKRAFKRILASYKSL